MASQIPKTMKAQQYSNTEGGLDNSISLTTIPTLQAPATVSKKPSILVSVDSASLNPADYKVPEKPLLGRLITKRPAIPCLDFAGRLVQIPSKGSAAYPHLADLKPGDPVFGRLDFIYQHGTLAEYTLAQPAGLTRLPAGLTTAQGAAIGTAGITAYQSLEPYMKAGDRIFINGGSGGVGTFGIQIAKLLGASHVTVSCSAANADLCRSLGADEVVDYRSVDVIQALKTTAQSAGKPFDLIVDNVPEHSTIFEESPAFLREGGMYVQVTATDKSVKEFWSMFTRALQPAWLGGVPRRWKILLIKNDPKLLDKLAEWASTGKLKVVIDSEYRFEEARQAFAKLKTGRARGKIIVNITDSK